MSDQEENKSDLLVFTQYHVLVQLHVILNRPGKYRKKGNETQLPNIVTPCCHLQVWFGWRLNAQHC